MIEGCRLTDIEAYLTQRGELRYDGSRATGENGWKLNEPKSGIATSSSGLAENLDDLVGRFFFSDQPVRIISRGARFWRSPFACWESRTY